NQSAAVCVMQVNLQSEAQRDITVCRRIRAVRQGSSSGPGPHSMQDMELREEWQDDGFP
ncbi:hypothetical protein KUCAC02_037766, partial [Chaenocephalus aceratus]